MSASREETSVGARSEPLPRRFRHRSLERQESVEDFVLAPGSPMQTVHQDHNSKIKTNGLHVNGSPALHSSYSYLNVPHRDALHLRPRSASPSLDLVGGQGEGEQEKATKSPKKHKGRSHFSMFRLHKHKKSKKYLKENNEAAMLSQSDGSSLLQQKRLDRGIHPNRRSFSGRPNRSVSPIGSTHSFPGFMESEGESEDEFLKTLMNPTNQSMGHRSPSPSPLLVRTPTPSYQQNSSVESDGGHSGTGGGTGGIDETDGGRGGRGANQAAGDTVSLTASQFDSSSLIFGSLDTTGPADTSSSANHQYLINVTLHSGHNLAIRDRTGSSDPYVKFKCGRFKYRSAVIHRNLNPEWNESFSFKSSTLDVPLRVRVYDHDYGSLDDYMGGQVVDLTSFANEEPQIIDIGLEDPVAEKRGENLGFLRLFIRINCDVEEDSIAPQTSRKGSGKERGAHLWSKVLNVTLLEGKEMPAMDDNGFSDPYCKFKLGPQKFESTIQSKTLNPRFYERFTLYMYDHDSTMLHIEVWDRDFPNPDDYIGSCSVNLSQLKDEEVHDIWLTVSSTPSTSGDCERSEVRDEFYRGTIHCLLQICSTNVEEEREDRPIDMDAVTRRYGLSRTADIKAFKKKDIGHLQIKIERCEDIPLMESYVVVKVGSKCVAQTYTCAKSTNPEWNQTFHFNVEDVNDELDVRVYKAKSEHLIGKIKLPLHRLEGGVSKDYVLKNKLCTNRTRGVIYMSCDLVYQPIRAGIRVFTPRDRVPEEKPKLQTKVLMNNIRRITAIFATFTLMFGYYNKMWSWEDKRFSTISLVVFSLICLFGQLWIGCLLLIFVFFFQYVIIYARGRHVWQLRRSTSIQSGRSSAEYGGTNFDDYSDFSDLEDELDSEEKTGLRGKIKRFQYVLVIVQDILGVIGDYEEKLKNLFNWSVPFLTWTAIAVLGCASVLLYFVPIRYIILVWGLNKFSKRLRNPHYVENNEITDFLSRCPTNQQLDEWRELSSHTPSSKSRGKAGKGKMKHNTSDHKLKKRK